MSILNEAIPTNVLKIELAMRIPEISKTEEVTFNIIVHLMMIKIWMAYIKDNNQYILARGCHLVTIAPIDSRPITAAMLFVAGPTIDVDARFRNIYSKYFGRNVANPTTAIRRKFVASICKM